MSGEGGDLQQAREGAPDEDQAMIILIAGASHAGKTLLAQRILEEIISHGTDIEDRLDNSGCTRNSLKEDNRNCAESFAKSGSG